ncbi:MAG TPA: FUSC family protein [Beijerinckiaceae bacterium]|nr:FUSC family protein [Beijerinckiaceae bacterium]
MVQALRMTVSSLGAFALAQALALPQGFWAVITALIVTQSNVGGSLKAALDRFIGSVFGALYGSAVAFAIPHEHGLSRAAALVVAVAPLSFMAALSAGFRVAPITAIIVLLSATGSTLGPFGFAVDRVLEVGLGCAVGLVVSVLIVPARASRLVLETASQVMRLLAEQLEALASLSDQAQADLGTLAVKTRQSLSKLETLVGEAARERRSRLADAADPEPLFRHLMRLRHDVVMLRRALREPGHEALREHVAQPWSRAAETGAAVLRDLGRALSEGRAPEGSGAMAEAVGAYRSALDEMRRRELTKPLPTEAVWRLFGTGFALEQFRRDLDDLLERAQEMTKGRERDVTR